MNFLTRNSCQLIYEKNSTRELIHQNEVTGTTTGIDAIRFSSPYDTLLEDSEGNLPPHVLQGKIPIFEKNSFHKLIEIN
jgi:hypothetical protein